MPTPQYGLDAYVYYNTGNYATPTWTSLNDFIINVSLNASKKEDDVSTRGCGIEITAGTMRTFSVDIDGLWDAAATGFQVLLDSFNGSPGATTPMLFLDKASAAGAEGLRAHMSVLKFDKTEGLPEAQKVSITVKPGPFTSGQAPAWYTGA